MLIAITRPVSPRIAECELSHYDRQPINVTLAVRQHDEYKDALSRLGCKVVMAPATPELPDSVFVEDCAVVLDEMAIITNPGAESRKPETETMASTLKPYRPLHFVTSPATLDGGDVLRIGKKIWIGLSGRSNRAALEQVRHLLTPYGYIVTGVPTTACLHLKSAVSHVGHDTVLLNPDWVDAGIFQDYRIVETHPDEPGAANALLIGSTVMFPAEFPHTARRLAEAGVQLLLQPNSEVIKAEGGLTCCSIVFSR